MESRRRQIVALLFIFFVMTTTVPTIATQNGPKAVLTGVFFDEGVDTDDDGAFDYLEVLIQVNVTQAGSFRVTIIDLLDSDLNEIHVFEISPKGALQYMFLDVGLWFFNISIEGPRIYGSQRNPCFIAYVGLSGEVDYDDVESELLDSRRQVPLSTEYLYTQFDPPGARLTGEFPDRGLDTDGDGTFDYLEVSVKVNVTEPGEYEVKVWGLYDTDWYEQGISVGGLASGYLGVGLCWLNVSLYGPAIYLSHYNPTHVRRITLHARRYYYITHDIYHEPLSRTYSYMDFDISVILVGVVSDQGVDHDADGYFDYLEIGVQVNVTDPGTYSIRASELLDTDPARSVEVRDNKSVYLDKGTHTVKLYFYGPPIHARGYNPAKVSYICVSWQYYSVGDWHDCYVRKDNVPLINSYSYTDFDIPAILVGVASDQGVDHDADGYFDYLEIGVQVNVTDPGTYSIYAYGLSDVDYPLRVGVRDNKSVYLDKGTHTVKLYFPGPPIHARRCNPVKVSQIWVNWQYDYWDPVWDYYFKMYEVPLTNSYSYTQFAAEAVPGVVVEEITKPELANATNPFVVNATEEAAASLIISEISDPITIIVKNVTDPVGVDTPPGTWEVLGNYLQITMNVIVNDRDIIANATIRMYYTLEQMEASGLDENTLEIRFWNATSGEWEPVESHVNTEEHFVWANIDHFSLWALMGQKPTSMWIQPQLLVTMGMTIAFITIATVLILIRKRKVLRPTRSQMKTK